jgi:60 kDa SS-A/Ro ribonucleoprotein
MTDSLRTVRKRPATKVAPEKAPVTTKAKSTQVLGNDGAYVFDIGDFEQAKRFLILGSEGNFYATGQEMSAQNAETVIRLASDPKSAIKLIDLIVEISTAGRAPKANPALFALAIAASHGSDESKAYALANLEAVARTATHLFLFLGYVEQFRGWGRALKRAVANWYTNKGTDKAAYQAVKYQNREGFSHRDAFRLSHPVTDDEGFKGLGEWILRGDASKAPAIVKGLLAAQETGADIPALIREYGLTWEMLPTESLNEVSTWEALAEKSLPLGALIRQLPRLTRIGFFKPFSDNTAKVVARLNDVEELRRARIHPINVLMSQKTYASGRSARGSSTWTPVREITDALNDAFYLAFETVEPAGKNTLIGVDVSPSMNGMYGYGTDNLVLTPAETAAALALVTMATEPKTLTYGFSSGLIDLGISPKDRLDTVAAKAAKASRGWGGTNPGALIEKAIQDNLKVETFLVITDNDANSGYHVFELLKKYRAKSGINARMIVLAVTATKFSIADPEDNLSLDIAGFDSATPGLIADFSRGL